MGKNDRQPSSNDRNERDWKGSIKNEGNRSGNTDNRRDPGGSRQGNKK